MNKFIIVIITTFLFLQSCHTDSRRLYVDKVMDHLEQLDISKKGNYTHIVIIPGAGCEGCISESESFFQECKDSSILFIFTKVNSIKSLKLKLGKKLEEANVYIDKVNDFLSDDEKINSYPLILDIRDLNNIVLEYLDPGVSFETMFPDGK